jgi:uncharacterized protein (DUF433 family)
MGYFSRLATDILIMRNEGASAEEIALTLKLPMSDIQAVLDIDYDFEYDQNSQNNIVLGYN